MENVNEKVQKVLTLISIVAVAISVMMFIGLYFGLKLFSNKYLLATFLTFIATAVVCFFSNGALDMYGKKKYLAIVSLALLVLSFLFGLINFWTYFELEGFFPKMSGIIAIASVLFVIIITTSSKLDNHYRGLQIITFSLTVILDIALTIVILGVDLFDNDTFVKIFYPLCFIVFALLCITNIISKRINKTKKDYIQISLDEYNSLKERIRELENENRELRG